MSEDQQSPSRRNLLKSLVFIPIGVAGATGAVRSLQASNGAVQPEGKPNPYTPAFFTGAEWRFIHAACDRLIPHDEHGPGALELGVPEFLDRHMQTPYASGDIWYMQGPYLEAAPEFGYQGRLPLRDILRVGIKVFDQHCAAQFGGKVFADLSSGQQDGLLKAAEGGKLKLEHLSEKLFFSNLLAEVRNGYFADPKHGGNKDMGSWKMIGYPGMRADYIDWVGVRDQPYPIGPVDLAGKRG
ncbi:gluconate 2-dehydrogenase subunit 3 family protein [Janthinobacterium agaricidamnosum]|uniref:Gluconate 2-dehydrogenase subunit 3 n=1 Tax=Janthinobacterium agaricidamnosum NBRC 102515 = DSM 9628 TaxID=1349767 RepID=W0V4D0_9BURK|nr:gluconate 2-dehydrogenase subunit 3 family protein [Janthinobacterium agaricidamnosum]CDG82127.1 gluconate 2-dehydrogenase subunit 3 [Janthinobacterium agaricidamnosum NBRC 102515 = DSM 9628]